MSYSNLVDTVKKGLPIDLQPGDKVVVAMSGGVDSSFTALLMKDLGFDVIGITLRLHEYRHARNGCAEENILDAQNVAKKIGMYHYILDRRVSFKQIVLKEFVDQYNKGMTPTPCLTCNKTMKFGHLLTYAKAIGAKCMVTGHYVRKFINSMSQKSELHCAIQAERDQSYFLFHLSRDELDYLWFPLGCLDKPSIRKYASEYGLCVADKPDSQDICFVPEGEKYQNVVESLGEQGLQSGEIVTINGEILGKHESIINYTVGQRKGLNLPNGPWFVKEIDNKTNRVIVCRKEDMYIEKIGLSRVSWLEEPAKSEIVMLKIRSGENRARATWDSEGKYFQLLDPEYGGAAPGQVCVAYRGTQVLGGGWIAKNIINV